MIMIIACMGCHLHWLAVLLLPVALWVMKIFRHKKGKCPCDCHNENYVNIDPMSGVRCKRSKCITPSACKDAGYCYYYNEQQMSHDLRMKIVEKENSELIEKIQPKK